MMDGNKEATKELAATFRILFTTAVSIVLLATNFQLRGQLVVVTEWMYVGSLASLVGCCLSCLILFLLLVPKLYHEEADIPYQPSVVRAGIAAFATFAAGATMLVGSQLTLSTT